MPTRIEAARVLYQLINSRILSDDLEQDLQNIAQCIEAEEKKEIFLWGAKDDDWLSDSGCILLYYLNILICSHFFYSNHRHVYGTSQMIIYKSYKRRLKNLTRTLIKK